MGEIWQGFKDIFAGGIELLHTWIAQVPFLADASWGWAIIALTVVVRIILLPLAAKQFTSMRKMQEIQPRVKALQDKYKVDRSMMRSDPERYREMQSKKNEKLQELYREEGVNPAAGCLPLLAQGPIFFALFSVLRDPTTVGGALTNAQFYFFTPEDGGLGTAASAAGWAGILLLVMVAGSMFVSQRQMMSSRTAPQEGAQATQQKVMLYVMPVMMGVFGWNLPIGVLLYWVTTNLWTMVQQWLITRRLDEEVGPVDTKPVPTTSSSGPRNVDATGNALGTAGNTRKVTRDEGSSTNGADPDRPPPKRSSRLPGRSRRRDDG
ncbi:membrane protein insertase YidC [Salsipaludibacter albus]|uniref:YidC/Oxa1 family membrane protein insertase n=1 Tax=Salsipaludibacter albus TaxID=2849650 RepID=UPI001EE4192D|nr:YidC/Oxa1 family membrane protein insertase [Salsipaludibacter albus]